MEGEMHHSFLPDRNQVQVVCGQKTHSRGIWFQENPFRQPQLVFLYQLILMIWLSQMLHFALKRLSQPKFVSYVLAGIILGPPLTGNIDGILLKKKTFPRHEVIISIVWVYIGIIYLIFLVAAKMDLSTVRKNVRNASFIGLTSVFCSWSVMSVLIIIVDPPTKDKSPFHERPGQFAFTLSTIRLTNLVYTFHELNIIASNIGQLAASAAMCTELLSWPWLVILIATTIDPKHNVSPWRIIGCSVLLVAVTICFIRPFFLWICRKTPEGEPVREIYIVVCILLVLCWGVIADYYVGSLYIGILAIGLVVPSGPPLGSTLSNKIEPFVMEILMPMCYLIVGSRVNITIIHIKVFLQIIFLVIMGAASKFFGAFVTGLACKVKPTHAVLLGLMLNIRGPLDLFLFLRWKMESEDKKDNGPTLSTEYYSTLVISELIVTVILSPMIVPLYRSCFQIQPTKSKMRHIRSVQTTPDNTELRVLCSVFNEGSVPSIASLLEALNPTAIRPLSVHIVHITELMGRAAPRMDSYGDQLDRVTSKRLHQIIVAVGNYLEAYSKNDVLQVRAHSVVAPYNSMHEYICRLAIEEELCLILVPFHKSTSSFHEFDLDATAGLRTFNINMQIHATFSVGIIMDRSIFRSTASISSSGYAAAVVFIGGPDDREALSLGIRISGSPMARVTLLRVIFNDLYKDNPDKTESKLDSRMVDEFKLRNAHSVGKYFEMVANDVSDVLSGIRTFIGDRHDLIIVGHAHKNVTTSMSDDVILDWSENPELGVIGDFIVSSDFCNSTSILVMQHYGGSNVY